MSLTVRRVGPASAAVVHAIIQEAFGSRPPLDPPADALSDTVSSIATRLALNGGLVAKVDGRPVGTLLFDPVGDAVYLRRFGVLTEARGHGVAAAMVQAATEAAVGRSWLRVVAREELPRTIAFWQHRGFMQTDRRSPYVELVRPVPAVHDVPTPERMRELGAELAADLRAGDLVVLTGDLGAGKTTFTQGLGAALGVEGPVTSPTFVIAREHPASDGGSGRVGLVHVDAYRLGGAPELDDLDLDTALDSTVTVVEWGEGLTEELSDSRVQVRIIRAPGVVHDEDHDPRIVEILRLGPRWVRV